MRNISFSSTRQQFVDGSKDVTRRMGWKFLKVGDRLRAVEKCQGLKKGEKVRVLGVIEVVGVRREPLYKITDDDVRREGFPDWTIEQFINFYCKAFGGEVDRIVTRIEFRKIKT